jgi:hypothetical protein
MADAPRPLRRDLLLGALGYGACSLAAYAVWAFGYRWFRQNGGDALLYPAVAAVLLLLPGFVLHPLAGGRLRFLKAYVPAFLAYAGTWSAVWFLLRFAHRDWLASALGSLAFVAVAAAVFRSGRGLLRNGLLFFALHSAGYFAGEQAYFALPGVPGMLAWGLLHGLGFGAGLALTFRTLR